MDIDFRIYKKSLVLIVLISISIRILYVLFSFNYNSSFHPEKANNVWEVFLHNDAGWYRYIAENGYAKISDHEELRGHVKGEFRQSEWAFFPAYPYLNKMTMRIFHLPYPQAAVLVSFLFSLLAFYLFFVYAKAYFRDEQAAMWTVLWFVVFPFNYHLSMCYTEAPFLVSTMAVYFAIKNGKIYWAIPFLILLTLLRPNGIIVAFSMFLIFLDTLFQNKKGEIVSVLFSKKTLLDVSCFLVAPLAFGAWCIYQYSQTGEYFAFSIAQDGWGKENMFPLLALFRKGDITSQINSFYICFLVLVIIRNRKKLTWSFYILIALTMIIPMSKGTVTSMYRYMTVLFPFYVFVFTPLLRQKRWIKVVVTSIFLIVQFYFFTYWMEWHTFSY